MAQKRNILGRIGRAAGGRNTGWRKRAGPEGPHWSTGPPQVKCPAARLAESEVLRLKPKLWPHCMFFCQMCHIILCQLSNMQSSHCWRGPIKTTGKMPNSQTQLGSLRIKTGIFGSLHVHLSNVDY